MGTGRLGWHCLAPSALATPPMLHRPARSALLLLHCRGGKGTCFAYGQTGSGKTYTMSPLPLRAAGDIFSIMQQPNFQGLSLHVRWAGVSVAADQRVSPTHLRLPACLSWMLHAGGFVDVTCLPADTCAAAATRSTAARCLTCSTGARSWRSGRMVGAACRCVLGCASGRGPRAGFSHRLSCTSMQTAKECQRRAGGSRLVWVKQAGQGCWACKICLVSPLLPLQVVGLREVGVGSLAVLQQLCDHAASARSTGSTGANDESSR